MKLYIIFSFFLIISSSFYCQNNIAANYDFDVRCQGKEMDGTLTLEVFGKGKNYKDALEQAKKNAVHAVIFKGIKDGSGECNSDPLLFSSSPETEFETYFAIFFKDGGEYLNFISLADEKLQIKLKRDAKKSKTVQQRMAVVRVDRLALKNKLKTDKIN